MSSRQGGRGICTLFSLVLLDNYFSSLSMMNTLYFPAISVSGTHQRHTVYKTCCILCLYILLFTVDVCLEVLHMHFFH